MKELVIISGKGGTGKTSITAAFASLANNAVLADCDVDAADLHIILEPRIRQESDFSGGKKAAIITEKCIGCGKCEDLCRFNAISLNGTGNEAIEKTYSVDPISCEGCKVCVEFCPVEAIEFKDAINGRWFISDTRFGPMVHAKLGIAEENSGKLVSLIRKEAKRIAEEQKKDLIIVDGSPGIGCPVIASITGANIVLIITEPTLSGKHDLERVADLASGFNIPTLVAVNKCDLNTRIAEQIEQDAHHKGLKVIGRISYNTDFTKAQLVGKSVIEYSDNNITSRIKSMWNEILDIINEKENN